MKIVLLIALFVAPVLARIHGRKLGGLDNHPACRCLFDALVAKKEACKETEKDWVCNSDEDYFEIDYKGPLKRKDFEKKCGVLGSAGTNEGVLECSANVCSKDKYVDFTNEYSGTWHFGCAKV